MIKHGSDWLNALALTAVLSGYARRLSFCETEARRSSEKVVAFRAFVAESLPAAGDNPAAEPVGR